jgi:hypothetical protein
VVARNVLLGLLGFVGIGAIAGGGALIVAPSGGLLGIPISILAASAFPDFLVPGLLLICFVGILPLLTAFALIAKPKWSIAERLNFCADMHWSWTACVYVAFTLIFWIQAEMLILHAVHWLHGFYTLLAVAILFVALLPRVRSHYEKNPPRSAFCGSVTQKSRANQSVATGNAPIGQ